MAESGLIFNLQHEPAEPEFTTIKRRVEDRRGRRGDSCDASTQAARWLPELTALQKAENELKDKNVTRAQKSNKCS
jgi:hypothetical protein